MIDTLVDNYILNIEKLGNVIEEQEKLLLTSGKELVENIYHYKTELSYVRNNVRPVKELMTRFCLLYTSIDFLCRRCYDHLLYFLLYHFDYDCFICLFEPDIRRQFQHFQYLR